MEGLDGIDTQLMAHLQKDGRISSSQLGRLVGLSPSACLRRVRRLEELGVIRGYVALVDRNAVRRGTSVFVEISLLSQAEEMLDGFEAEIATVPEVISCHLMAGSSDYLVHVTCDGVADYERIHRSHLAKLPGVASLRSSFAIREVMDTTTLTLDAYIKNR